MYIIFYFRLFDMCNSRNPYARNFKAPIGLKNENCWRPFLIDAFLYITKLKTRENISVFNSKRKTPFLGYLMLIKTIFGIHKNYITTNKLKCVQCG